MKNFLKLFLFSGCIVLGAFFVFSPAQALTIADYQGIPSACPNKYPNNTKDCTVFINSITVNGFIDNDTSYTARTTPVPYGYLKPGQTITISWTDNTDGWNDPQGTSLNNYLVKYGCGNSLDLNNDDYTIGEPVGRKYISWTVPTNVSGYQYCKIWVYAKGINQNNQPTLGVSNTRAFSMQAPAACQINSFTASANNILSGENVTLSWSTSHCNACTAVSNPNNSYWTGAKNTSGTNIIYNLTQDTGFTLICTNDSSPAQSKNLIVSVTTPPTKYTCNSNYQCVQASNGEYTSLASCYNNCVAAAPTLSFWADDYTLTQGEATYLRWNATNVDYCVASNGWSGTKNTAYYESVSPTAQTTYTLTCSGAYGTISRSLTIYVASPTANLSFTKLGRNLSLGERTYSKIITVTQGEVIEFYLTVTAGSSNDLSQVIVTDSLPSVLTYRAGTTKVDGVIQGDTITTGLNLGTISRGTSKTITFQALANNPGTVLTYTNTARVTASNINSLTDTATINYGLVAGASTIETGAPKTIQLSLILSLGLASCLWAYLEFHPQGH